MKTRVLILGFAFLSFMNSNAQNVLKGSNMEKADSVMWDTCSLQNDPTATFSYDFGYQTVVPTYGSGGALHITQSNIGTNGSELMFFQQVTLTKGHQYVANMGVKMIQPMDHSWIEVYVGGMMPVHGSDYTTTVPGPSQFIGGFKWTGWENGCLNLGDAFDATLKNHACEPNGHDTVLFAGSGDTTVYFGFKSGIYGYATSIEYVVDSVTLTDLGIPTAIRSASAVSFKISPDPVENVIYVQSDNNFVQARITNMLGQEVLKKVLTGNRINVSSLNSGFYILELKDAKNNTATSKFYKK